jgi:ATP-dependent exoDNAse (exonuclease V) alpha subunit
MFSDTLFIIDEASMISTMPQIPSEGMPMFIGNGGGVIDDLVTYVYSGKNCRMLLLGDTAQLPPVGEDEAPALRGDVLRCYGLSVVECDISEVVRQQQQSGILWNATQIRRLITHDEMTQLPRIRFSGFADIQIVPGNELIDALASSYSSMGVDDTVVITRSNKRANIYNGGIRARVLDYEEELSSGDRIMIVKNHYFDEVEKPKDDNSVMSFIANGDVAVVRRVRHVRELYGFRFADLTLRFPDYDDVEMELTAILDVLSSDAAALTSEQQRALYEGVMEDYMHIPRKEERLKQMREDIYYNSLQIKYAYAVTCHKAQGGQWSHVYIDQGYMTDDMLTPDYIHWLYTAFTRATKNLFLVNWTKEQTLED